MSTLRSKCLLEILYIDVWGFTPIEFVGDFKYYVIFVDHFTKYVWLYPLCLKSNVSDVFLKFKASVETFFKTPIISIYSDGGGEYQKLKSYLLPMGFLT